jgi:hypothetical protein
LFAAHRNELKVLLREEHAAFDAGSDGVLVVGGHGSGRTSMLNLAQTEFRAARIIRLGHEQVRAGGFLMALAAELQCDPIPGDVRAGLASEPTSVLVDDLEQWFLPDTDGLQELERILDIVLTTRHVAFWAMTMSEDALSIVDPIFALRQAFGRVINLGALDADALAHVIETRNKVSGLAIEYPRIRFAGLFGDRQDEANRQAYYRNLARTSRGNLQAALRVWHRDIELGEGDVVRPRLRSNVLTGPRFLSQLHPHAVAIVVQGMRFGVVEVEHLRRTLGISRGEINRHLAFLRAAGILQRRSAFSGGLRISPAVQPTIVDTLSDAGALRRST